AKGRAALRSGDVETAFRELGDAARSGEPEAQYLFATMMKDGVGLGSPDLPAAVAWYDRAAKAGHAEAQVNLGYMLFHGEGITPDREAGLYWYEQAAKTGLATAQYNAAKVYWDGDGVKRDPARARALFAAAAKQGLSEAQFALGIALLTPPVDDKAAFSWFSRAAAQGAAEAYGKLAGLYVLGRGSEKDPVAAAMWAVLAEGAGDPMARQLRLKLENDLTPEQKAEAMARARAFVPRSEMP
ncbi:MAG: sel1 repeat family protein, partial [Rhodospirillaceae bacterium]|nr:sel1 repeat family protein [Rhodospirillaceae bacterium]